MGTRTFQPFQPTLAPLGAMPGVTPLYLDYVGNWDRVAPFYGHAPSLASIAAFARQRPPLGGGELNRLCAALDAQQARWGAPNRGVAKLQSGAVAVVTGQQPGLFTGPLYAIFKALSAIKLARELEALGIAATAVFWIASEDHDQEEIRSTTILDRDGAPHRLKVDLIGDAAAPAGWTRYGGDIPSIVADCIAGLPVSEFIPELHGMLEAAYAPGVSPVDAFARLMAQLFTRFDLTLVDPLDPQLKALAEPILEDATRRNDAVRLAVQEQGRALVAAGYHEQVRVGESFTGLFGYEGGIRRALKPEDLKPGLALSPNALLRPVVQDFLFPTAAYVGGPAEIAYFAQASAIYRALARPMPPAVPRLSATLVEPRIVRALEAYALDPVDAWQGRDFLARKAGAALAGAAEFDRVHATVGAALDSLRPIVDAVDVTLAGALETSRQKMLHHVEALRMKYVNAETKRGEMLDRRLDAVVHALYPEKKLQERSLSFVSFLARYGPGLVDRLEAQLAREVAGHQFIGIT